MPQYFSFNPTQPNPSHVVENATQPNATHGWTKPVSISDLHSATRDAATTGTRVLSRMAWCRNVVARVDDVVDVMPVQSHVTVDDQWRETTMQISPPMSSYLVCVVICEFAHHYSVLGTAVPVRNTSISCHRGRTRAT